MMCVRLTGGGQTAMLLADLVPTDRASAAAVDHGLRSLPHGNAGEQKKWLPELVRGDWLAIFGHDPKSRRRGLRERDGKVVAEPVEVD